MRSLRRGFLSCLCPETTTTTTTTRLEIGSRARGDEERRWRQPVVRRELQGGFLRPGRGFLLLRGGP